MVSDQNVARLTRQVLHRALPDDDLLLHLLHFQIALHCGLAAVIVAQANTTKVVSLIELEKYVFFFWKNI